MTTVLQPAEPLEPADASEVAALDEPAAAASPSRWRRRRAPKRSIKLHRWLGWFLGLWIVFEAVTGTYLVFADDIDVATHQDRYHQTDGDVGPAAAAAGATAEVEGVAAHVFFPDTQNGVYLVEVRSDDGTDESLVYVDPGTGEVNEVVGPGTSFHYFVLDLHYRLNRTELLGFSTMSIVGWLGIVWLLQVLVGYRASRPHRRTLKQAKRVRRERGRFTFNLDLHKVIGLVILVPLVLIVITGIALEFRPQSKDVIDAVTPGKIPDAATFALPFSIPTGNEPRLDLDTLLAKADEQGFGGVQSVEVPVGNPAGTFVITVDQGGRYEANLEQLSVYLDQYSGQVLAQTGDAEQSIGEQIQEDYIVSIHFGYVLRWWTKVAWGLIGVSVVVLAITGINMRRAKWAKRRPDRAVGAAPEPEPTPTEQGAS